MCKSLYCLPKTNDVCGFMRYEVHLIEILCMHMNHSDNNQIKMWVKHSATKYPNCIIRKNIIHQSSEWYHSRWENEVAWTQIYGYTGRCGNGCRTLNHTTYHWIIKCLHYFLHWPSTIPRQNSYWILLLKQIMIGTFLTDWPLLTPYILVIYCCPSWVSPDNAVLTLSRREGRKSWCGAAGWPVINTSTIGFLHKECYATASLFLPSFLPPSTPNPISSPLFPPP